MLQGHGSSDPCLVPNEWHPTPPSIGIHLTTMASTDFQGIFIKVGSCLKVDIDARSWPPETDKGAAGVLVGAKQSIFMDTKPVTFNMLSILSV